MHLTIQPNRLIGDVQKDFNDMFPYLKIEFFKKNLSLQVGSGGQKPLPPVRKVAESQLAITDGEIDIRPEMTVKDLEYMLGKHFSLSVQLYRRSGNIWLETTMTDSWTLKHQNEHGREISTGNPKNNITETEDYDLTRDPGNDQ
jgi:hypothetical protein